MCMNHFSSSGQRNLSALIFMAVSRSCVSRPFSWNIGGQVGSGAREANGSSGNFLITLASSGNTPGTGFTLRSTRLYAVSVELLLEFLTILFILLIKPSLLLPCAAQAAEDAEMLTPASEGRRTKEQKGGREG